ncbi:SGNH/GDSL hydrolase family protein [bacterium]|nr:SGNH/GDSL hydrolase family protein [candidate division CSSED10-310 bacterium]
MRLEQPRILCFVCWIALFSLTAWSGTSAAGIPEIVGPADDARFGSDNGIVVLEWTSEDCLDFQVDIAVDADFAIGTGPMAVIGASFLNVTDLVGDDVWFPLSITLYWRVRCLPESGEPGGWSDVRVFHKSTLESLLLHLGADGRYSPTTTMPRLTWETTSSASAYDIAFSVSDAFDPELGCVRITESSLDFSDVNRDSWDLLEGVFYWRICAVHASGVPGPWSETGRLSKTRIDAPTIISPTDGHVYPPLSSPPILSWQTLNTLEQYQLRLYADPTNESGLLTIDHSGSTTFNFKTDFGALIDDETWHYAPFTVYWAIAGCDAEGRPGPFSAPRELIKPGWHRFAGYGDSITAGECVDDAYLGILDTLLVPVWGEKTSHVNIAVEGMKSKWGADNAASRLRGACPQFVLIMFGTNDSVDPGNCDPPYECDIAGHLAEMGSIARNHGSIPIISTIIPVNPDGKQAQAQSDIDDNNDAIIAMADQMDFELVDLSAMFFAHGSLPELFCDWGHPNEEGYRIMASGFYDGIMNAVN